MEYLLSRDLGKLFIRTRRSIVFDNVSQVIYRFPDDIIDVCSERNNIDARKIAENFELLLFIRYWIDKNLNYQEFFEEQIGKHYLRKNGVVFNNSVNSLFMFLVMNGKIPVMVREHGMRISKRMETIGDLALLSYTKQSLEGNDDRLKRFYTYQGDFGTKSKKRDRKFHRNIRGMIDIIGGYQEVARHFGREVNYDDFRNH